jgi:RNA polymerase sigma-70 factor (ECF subfamily)
MQVAMHMARLDAAADAASASASVEACYAAHHAKVLHLGLRYGRGDAAWAEDLAHDVFVKLAEHRAELHSLDDIGGWLYRVASNLAISRLRRETSFWRRVAVILTPDRHEVAQAPDAALEQQQLADRAMAALHALPPKQRVVLSMKILDGKSQAEIAALLSMSEGYVSKLVARALRRPERLGWEVTSC